MSLPPPDRRGVVRRYRCSPLLSNPVSVCQNAPTVHACFVKLVQRNARNAAAFGLVSPFVPRYGGGTTAVLIFRACMLLRLRKRCYFILILAGILKFPGGRDFRRERTVIETKTKKNDFSTCLTARGSMNTCLIRRNCSPEGVCRSIVLDNPHSKKKKKERLSCCFYFRVFLYASAYL